MNYELNEKNTSLLLAVLEDRINLCWEEYQENPQEETSELLDEIKELYENVLGQRDSEYFGKCDSCGDRYELSSRVGRCGDCEDCSLCCVHTGASKGALQGVKTMPREELGQELDRWQLIARDLILDWAGKPERVYNLPSWVWVVWEELAEMPEMKIEK